MTPDCQTLIKLLKIQLINGIENGELRATHYTLQDAGITQNKIQPTINEAVRLGLIEVSRGRSGNRFTLLPSDDDSTEHPKRATL